MSTRCSLAYDGDFHLYQECFENDNVYLELDKGGWAASLNTDRIDWRHGKESQSILLSIDVTLWRKIVEGWMQSQWGSDPTYDHKPLVFSTDILETLSKFRVKNEENTNNEPQQSNPKVDDQLD